MLVVNRDIDIYMFANVDALASEETPDGGNKCYKLVNDDPSELPGTYRGGMNFCKP